jgi:hypothetical protein
MRTAGKAGGSAPNAEPGVAAVEIAHLAGAHMRGTDGQARLAFIEQVEIDEIGERAFQRRRRVVAGIV